MPASLPVARPLPLFAVALGLLALASAAHAQSSPFLQRGAPVARDTHTAFPYEHVDPLSGNLLLVTTDLALPGNAGFDLAVTRVYNSKIHPRFEDQQDTTLEERSWVGVGWRLHFGRVINPSALTPGTTQIEMSDGSRHPLQTTTAFPEGWMTREFWRYDRATHTLKLPTGLVYTFGHVAAPNGLLTDVRYVTRIEDPYGNTLVFTYFAAPGPTDGVQTITQHLGGGQTRQVTFTVDPATGMLQTMALGTRTWTYTLVAANVTDHYWLRDVQAPGNLTRWHYEYGGALPGGELTALVAPSGGRVEFTYATQARLFNQRTVPSRVVTARTTAGVDAPGTWAFAYGQGAAADTSVVTTPCAVETYRYLGVGTAGPFNAWRSGVLAERTTAAPGGPVLDREELTWTKLDALSPDVILPVPGGSDGDPAIYVPRLMERRVTRGLQAWRTTFEFHLADGRFNDYGRPWRVRAYDEGNVTHRVVETSYEYGFLQSPSYPYVLPVGTVTETRGGESAHTTFGYHLPTGFVLTTTARGVTTTLTKTPQGNIASVADAAARTTRFEYSWGVVSRIVPPAPAPVITRGVSDHSLVTSEHVGPEVGGLTTTFDYDAAGRLTWVIPPGGGARWPTLYNYDPTHSRYVRVVQGDFQEPSTQRVTLTELDYFGRAIQTRDPAGVKVATAYDACGRVTAQSLPYADTAWEAWGTTWTYDALGRVLSAKTQTAPSVFATTTWAYTGADVTVTDPLGRTTTYDVQAFGDPSAARLRTITDAAGQVTTYQYAVAGQVAEVRGPGTGPTPTGPVRTWVYHPTTGLLLSDTQPESGATTYGYEAGTGRLTSVTHADATVTTLLWDAAGRPTGRDVQGTTVDDVAVTYDALGRIGTQRLGPASGGVLTTWNYHPTTGGLVSRQDAVDNRTFTSTYAYNAYDDVVQVGYPRVGGTGRLVSYAIEAPSGRLTGVTTTANGATIPFAANFVYDGAGRLTSYQTGPVTHTVAFDQASRPTAISAVGTGVGAAQRLELGYTYNAGSEVTAITDGRAGAGQTFSYDLLGRIRTAMGPYGSLTWTHDATGNRTELLRASGPTTTYGYDAATQRLTSVGGPGAETLTYDALGRVTSDSAGTYTYRAGGAVATVTRAGLSASYDYDSDGWRIKRTVNGTPTYALRGPDGGLLSTFEVLGGAVVWTRDEIRGLGRVLGAVTRVSVATVAFVAAASAVGESDPTGTARVGVRVTTADGLPLAAPVTVFADTRDGTAAAPGDYGPLAGQALVFGAGTASGTVQDLVVPVVNDGTDEADETLTVRLTAALGGAVRAPAAHLVTLLDDDPPAGLFIYDHATVDESAGQAWFGVAVTPASAKRITVTYATADGSALSVPAVADYQARTGTLVIEPGQTGAQITVPLVNDAWAEPLETFTVTLSNPVHATLTRATGVGYVTSQDDPAPVTLDPSRPAWLAADGVADAPVGQDYLFATNPHATAVPVRITAVRPDGSGRVEETTIPAGRRLGLALPAVAPAVGLALQSLAPGLALADASHTVLTGTPWTTGHATELRPAAPVWYFAEGHASGYFDETLSVVNPGLRPVRVVVEFYGSAGAGGTLERWIPTGPGQLTLRVNDLGWVQGDHSTIVRAFDAGTGAAVPVAAARTMRWAYGDQRETHGSPGVATAAATWDFAEGNQGTFATYLALFNPGTVATSVRVTYRHENGVTYPVDVTVPAASRATLLTPALVPAGSVGLTVSTTPFTAAPIVVERSLYGNPDWSVGTSGVGTPVRSATWHLAEGWAGAFDTYVLVTNPNATATTATVTCTQDDGTVRTAALWVPAQGRATLWAGSVAGLTGGFRTTVTASVPIVVERAMYWPGTAGAAANPPPTDFAPTAPGPASPQPYTALVEATPVGPISAARAAGSVSPEETARLAAVAATRARLGPAAGVVTFTTPVLPWVGGHVVLGRVP